MRSWPQRTPAEQTALDRIRLRAPLAMRTEFDALDADVFTAADRLFRVLQDGRRAGRDAASDPAVHEATHVMQDAHRHRVAVFELMTDTVQTSLGAA